jgi:uncharacterized protein (TIGR03032 family)
MAQATTRRGVHPRVTVREMAEAHNRAWRHPAQAMSTWPGADATDPRLLEFNASTEWWDLLRALEITLLVTREYEHLVIGMRATDSGPEVSYLPLPHPSGITVDRTQDAIYIASTRNPNQVYAFRASTPGGALLPSRSWFLPGRLYIHDLALVGGELCANAVGENAVVAIDREGGYSRRWWPRAIETDTGPAFELNYLQLNSIAAGATLETSFYSASTDRMSKRRPGHLNFPVDKRGVIFSGCTREAVVRGLTRPHSARLHDNRLWVDNSGYGEFGVVCGSRFESVVRLQGWTRGLTFVDDVAFVATSRVLPRFHQYAPGLDASCAECALHAVDLRSGRTLAGLRWPAGNQIFGLDWLPSRAASGLPFEIGAQPDLAVQRFYRHESEP